MRPSLSNIVSDKNIYVYHSQTMPFIDQGITHFALIDSLMNEVARSKKIILHFWPTHEQVFLGMQDTRLPHLNEALEVLESEGYDYIVRNSGGLGVVSDQGVLNLSLIIPNENTGGLSIDQAYEIMYDLLKLTIDMPIEAKEIPNSYCPGDFDISIKGQKISGISQRRRVGSLAIMLYLSIEGNQERRSKMMKNFYDQGLQKEDSHWIYPDINPDVMTNLDRALSQKLSTQDVEKAIRYNLESLGAHLVEGDYSERILQDFEVEMEQMVKRNHRMLGDKFKL